MKISFLGRKTLATAAIALTVGAALSGCVASKKDAPAPAASDSAGAAPAVKTITPGVLKIGSQQSYIPGEFFPEGKSTVEGFGVDFVTELGKRLGLKTEWVQVDYSAIIAGLKANQFDMGSGGMSPNPDRLKEVDMVGYFQSGATFILRKADAGKYKDALSFCGQTIGMLKGSTTLQKSIDDANTKCTGGQKIAVTEYTTTPLGLQDLRTGRIAAYTPDVAQTQYIVKENPNDFAAIGGGYKLVDYLINYTFTKNNTALRNAVFAKLQDMMTDGSYQKILDKWGITDGALKAPVLNNDPSAKP